MSNKTQLQTNNTTLSSLIETLRGKAAGGGGGSVETCSVSVSFSAGYPFPIIATTATDGVIDSYVYIGASGTLATVALDNVLCNSVVYIRVSGLGMVGCTINGAERLYTHEGDGTLYGYDVLIKMPQEAGANVTVEIYDND